MRSKRESATSRDKLNAIKPDPDEMEEEEMLEDEELGEDDSIEDDDDLDTVDDTDGSPTR